MATIGVASKIGSAGTVANGGTISDSLLSSEVSNILGLQSSATLTSAYANSQSATISGYNAETAAYGDVQTLSENNAAVSQAYGNTKVVQEQQKLATDIGAARSAIAGGGFKESGSNLDILRSSFQQGLLTQQLTEAQTSLNVGGYLAEGLAAKAEGAASQAAADSAQSLENYYKSASSDYTTKANDATSLLNDYLSGGSLTGAENLIVSPISSGLSNVSGGQSASTLVKGGGTTTTSGTVAGSVAGTPLGGYTEGQGSTVGAAVGTVTSSLWGAGYAF